MQTHAVIDPRRRLRVCLWVFLTLLAVVFARAVQLEVTQGAAFRQEALQPLAREKSLPGVRGRILARDGTVLACDKKVVSLAVHYRYLQEPPDARWLRLTALRRLPPAERRNRQRLADEEKRVQANRAELALRLQQLADLTPEQWSIRAHRTQARVERIAEGVNRRLAERRQEEPTDVPADSLLGRVGQSVLDALRGSLGDAQSRVIVAEERDYHVMVEDVSLAVVAEIEGHAERYPGVKVVEQTRRIYPSGPLGAHVLGHLGQGTMDTVEGSTSDSAAPPQDASEADDLAGQMGVERQYETLLRARRGTLIELTDHSGRILSSHRQREPGVGRDLALTLDSQLQQAAEGLLDSALARRTMREEDAAPAGGAVIVMDVHSGAVLVAASAPRFDPNVFLRRKPSELAALLADKAHPLFDRAIRMALPPGSVFKTVAAVAMLEGRTADPASPFFCQGYLHQPDHQRCAIYVRHGTGHGEVTLPRALAVSCNVYFFHHAEALNPAVLVQWADRFGFGRATGVDLPGEATGTLPTPDTIRRLEGHAWHSADTQAVTIGQGSLTATPLQIARLMAAVANGGQLVTPHVARAVALPDDAQAPQAEAGVSFTPPRPIRELKPETLAAIREGLNQVVADSEGTAHGTVYLETIAIAGKTGTAQAGAALADHAWFAGYVPADKPRMAIVVVLEHAGDAATAAGPVVRRLVRQMQQFGMF